MLCLQFILYLSSFVGTLENEIPGAALEPCQLKSKQFSPDILKFSTKHKENPFTFNYSVVPCIFFLFIFHAGSHILGSNSFWNSTYKEKMPGSARVSRRSSASYDYDLSKFGHRFCAPKSGFRSQKWPVFSPVSIYNINPSKTPLKSFVISLWTFAASVFFCQERIFLFNISTKKTLERTILISPVWYKILTIWETVFELTQIEVQDNYFTTISWSFWK